MTLVFDKGCCSVFFSPATTTRGVFGAANFLGVLTAIDFKFRQQLVWYEGKDCEFLCYDLRLLQSHLLFILQLVLEDCVEYITYQIKLKLGTCYKNI